MSVYFNSIVKDELFAHVQYGVFGTLTPHGNSRPSIVVSTVRCGRTNPGSIPGTGILFFAFVLVGSPR